MSQSIFSQPISMDYEQDHDHERESKNIQPQDAEKNDDKKAMSNDVFGDEADAEIKYKVLSWWQAGFLMVAETVSIGILSLPSVVAALGLVPSIILLVAIGLMSTYTGYTMGQFRWAFPHVQSMADAGEVLAGGFGREFLGMGQLLLIVFIMASHLLTFTVAMNTITDHGTCTVVFGVVGLVISYVLCLPRNSAKVSYLSVGSFLSVLSSVLIVMIAVGVQKPWKGELEAVADTNLYHAFLGVCNIVFSFSGHVAFFSFISELKDPREFPKSLCLLQGTDTILYIVSAVVIYCYAGPHVTSPALGSASPIIGKIAYGIALPTIIIGGVVNGHVASKYIYVRVFKGTDRIHKNDIVAVGSWVAITFGTWVVAWIIASAIPVFNNLLSLIASLFASWFTYGFNGMFWLYLNKDKLFRNPRKIFLTVVNLLMIAVAAAICGLGLWVSGRALHEDSGHRSFSCANNANV
ncbi:hypothetical protein BDW74DRAFT_113184 [Aspergillus multicolor]|uniref:uncharacterized protein n=1 Tax=Aspergillus multicolor TaxID=41759 RepID=UPI003CCE3AE1